MTVWANRGSAMLGLATSRWPASGYSPGAAPALPAARGSATATTSSSQPNQRSPYRLMLSMPAS